MTQEETQERKEKSPRQQGGAQSIRRTIAILRSVSKFNREGARLSLIAKDVGLPPPTVHRILAVLHEEDFLSFDPSTKLYHLGMELYSLGAATQQLSIRDRYHTALERICEQTNDVIHLVVRSGYDGVCIDQVTGNARVQVLGFDVGERRLLGIGAAGQALLAFLPEKQRESIIAANSHGYMKYYGIGAEEVREWLRNTRKKKYANSIHIVSPESIGVGVPVFNRNGQVVAAISMAGISGRMTSEKCREIAEIMQSEIEAVDPPPG
jgi:DNA-binding IclR family transcriptional regulator